MILTAVAIDLKVTDNGIECVGGLNRAWTKQDKIELGRIENIKRIMNDPISALA